eukprot:gene25761-31112_t
MTIWAEDVDDGRIWAETILLSNQPMHYTVFVEELSYLVSRNKSVLNYSQVYSASTSPSFVDQLVAPIHIRSGDIVQINPGPHGIGAHYAIWLLKDLVHHDLSALDNLPKCSHASSSKQTCSRLNPPIDPFAWGLSDQELKQLKKVFCVESYEQRCRELQSMLLSNKQELFQSILNDNNMEYENAVKSLRFKDDFIGKKNEVKDDNDHEDDSSNDDWPLEYLTPYGTTPHASQHFAPPFAPYGFPHLLSRAALQPICHNGIFDLYLFPHIDELGYAAPPAMSIAPYCYFPWEYSSRHIDLSLLPYPLGGAQMNEDSSSEEAQGTVYGRVLTQVISEINKLKYSMNNENVSIDEAKEGYSSTEKHLEDGLSMENCPFVVDPLKTIVEIDFEVEDEIRYFDLSLWSEDPSVALTREIFSRHASGIRQIAMGIMRKDENLGAVGCSSLDELVELFRSIMHVTV